MAICSQVFAATYYVRPDGNDGRDGLSEANAWATVGKVSSFAASPGFKAGDKVLFKGGASFTTSAALLITAGKSGGTAAAPLTIGSYGTGRAVIRATACRGIDVQVPSGSGFGLRIENLNLVGNGQGMSRSGQATGLYIKNSSSGSTGLLHVENCDISGFAGNGLETGRGRNVGFLKNLVIRNVQTFNNPGLKGVTPHTGSGTLVSGADGALVEHCRSFRNGINNDYSGGPIGIWFWDCINSTIQYCESYDNQTTRGDGGGFDLDGGCRNCFIQYCYSHGNAGAGYLVMQFQGASRYPGPLENNTIRYCISENDGRKGGFGSINFNGASATDYVGTTYVYNNVFYMGGIPESGDPTCVGLWSDNIKGIHFYNNIFMADNGRRLVYSAFALTQTHVRFAGNCYATGPRNLFRMYWAGRWFYNLADLQSNTGQEMLGGTATGMEADPLLVDPGSGGTIGQGKALSTLTAYRIPEKSPARDAGLDLKGLFGIDPGTCDFWGTPVPYNNHYDIGAYEYAASGPALFVSEDTLRFSMLPGGAAPAPQTLTATVEGGLSLDDLAVSETAGWLTVEVSGSAAARTLTNTISPAGLLAGTHAAGVTLTAGGITRTYCAVLTIADLHIKMNAGANTVPGWEADDDYVAGGSDFSRTNAIDLSGAAGPGPEALYQSCRNQEPVFTFPQVPDGKYTVRLHYADPVNDTDVRRKMVITIEGKTVETAFNVCALSGGAWAAVVKDYMVIVADGNGLNVSFAKGAGNDAFVSGIEIIAQTQNSISDFHFSVFDLKPDAHAVPADVYDLRGRRVDLSRAPAGVYLRSADCGRILHKMILMR